MAKETASDDRIRFGQRLAAARKACELSQEAVGARYGLTKATVSSWEKGNSDPGCFRLKELAALYGVSPESLLMDSTISKQAKDLAERFDAMPPEKRSMVHGMFDVVHPKATDVISPEFFKGNDRHAA